MCKIRKADFKYNRVPRVVNKRKKTKKKKKERMPVNKKPPESPESASPILSDIDVQITTNGDVSRKPPSPSVVQIITDEGVDLHLGTTDVPDITTNAADGATTPLPVNDMNDKQVITHEDVLLPLDADATVAADEVILDHSATTNNQLARDYENLGQIWNMFQKRGHTLSPNILQQRGVSITKKVDREDGGTDYHLLFSLK